MCVRLFGMGLRRSYLVFGQGLAQQYLQFGQLLAHFYKPSGQVSKQLQQQYLMRLKRLLATL